MKGEWRQGEQRRPGEMGLAFLPPGAFASFSFSFSDLFSLAPYRWRKALASSVMHVQDSRLRFPPHAPSQRALAPVRMINCFARSRNWFNLGYSRHGSGLQWPCETIFRSMDIFSCPLRSHLFISIYAAWNSKFCVRAKLTSLLMLWEPRLPGGELLAFWGLLHHDHTWLFFFKCINSVAQQFQVCSHLRQTIHLRKAPVRIWNSSFKSHDHIYVSPNICSAYLLFFLHRYRSIHYRDIFNRIERPAASKVRHSSATYIFALQAQTLDFNSSQ